MSVSRVEVKLQFLWAGQSGRIFQSDFWHRQTQGLPGRLRSNQETTSRKQNGVGWPERSCETRLCARVFEKFDSIFASIATAHKAAAWFQVMWLTTLINELGHSLMKNNEKNMLPGQALMRLREDPLDLSFWSFLTFLHHGIEEVKRHLLWKFFFKKFKGKVGQMCYRSWSLA